MGRFDESFVKTKFTSLGEQLFLCHVSNCGAKVLNNFETRKLVMAILKNRALYLKESKLFYGK